MLRETYIFYIFGDIYVLLNFQTKIIMPMCTILIGKLNRKIPNPLEKLSRFQWGITNLDLVSLDLKVNISQQIQFGKSLCIFLCCLTARTFLDCHITF